MQKNQSQDNNIQPIKIGVANFFPIVNQLQLIYEDQIARYLTKKITWQISKRKYFQYNWKQVFRHMNLCEVQQISLRRNKNSQIIKEINNIKFFFLKILDLASNNIDNIQALTYLKCIQLNILNLKNNNISNLRSLKKLTLQKLFVFHLEKNKFIQIQRLNQAKLEKLMDLNLQQLNTDGDQIELIQDLSIFIRLLSPIQRLAVGFSNKRIYQQNVKKMLQKNRFCQDRLYVFQSYRSNQIKDVILPQSGIQN